MGIQINGATDSITAIDGTIDVVSAIGNAGVVTATAFVGNITGNVTGNINHTSNLELQTGGVTRAHFNSSGHFGIAGISTFSDDVKFTGNNYNVLWDKSDNSLKFDTLAKIKLADQFEFYHSTNGVLHNKSGITFIYGSGSGNISLQAQTGAQNISCAPNGGTSLYYQGDQKLYTVSDGVYINDNLGIQDSIQHILDTNTKIRFPANDTISFETAGSERLRIMSGGAIGINTTTGTNTVNIGGAAGLGFKFHNFTSGNSSYITVESGDKLQSNVGGSGYYTWVTGGSEKLRITSDGEVGISPGSVTPTAGDLQTGDSQNKPLIHVKGSGVSATGGEYNLIGRFEAGGDADDTGAMVVLNHSNDRGLALIGGRATSNNAFAALKMIDNVGRLTDIMTVTGYSGQGVGNIKFFTGNSTTTTERVRITGDGTTYFYGNQTSAPEGDFGFRWDRNQPVNLQITNTNNTSVNAGARITLKSNIGTIAGSYYNNGGFYLINSANGYFNYYSNSILRVNINTNGDVYLNPDDANGIPTSNGNVGRRFGIKSTLNNIIIGETTNSGNFGLILESRVTGRTGNARSSQIGLGNGVIDFYTAAPSAGVTKRMEIASDGEIKCVGAADNKGFGVYISSTQRVAELIEHSADGEMRLYTGNATPLLKTVITSYGSSYINAAGTCRFGVGTSSPSARMHLYDTGTANSNGFRFETGTSGQTAKFVIKTTDNGDESKYLRLSGHWTELGVHNNEGFRIRNSSNNIALYVNSGGSYAFSGSNLSDRNLKEDIETISTPTIDLIKQVSPKLFKWKNDINKTQHGGFIAQEMQPLFPKLISGTDYDESRTDYGDPNEDQAPGNPTGLAFDYDGYTAYLTKAMQELIAKVESLEAEVAALKSS